LGAFGDCQAGHGHWGGKHPRFNGRLSEAFAKGNGQFYDCVNHWISSWIALFLAVIGEDLLYRGPLLFSLPGEDGPCYP
jgi:hypothetical protein